MPDGETVTAERYRAIREQELRALTGSAAMPEARFADAAALLDDLVLGETFAEFLTIPGTRLLERVPHGEGR